MESIKCNGRQYLAVVDVVFIKNTFINKKNRNKKKESHIATLSVTHRPIKITSHSVGLQCDFWNDNSDSNFYELSGLCVNRQVTCINYVLLNLILLYHSPNYLLFFIIPILCKHFAFSFVCFQLCVFISIEIAVELSSFIAHFVFYSLFCIQF